MVIGGFRSLSLNDFPGCTAAVVFTVGCNFRCGYCHNPELVREFGSAGVREFPIEEVLRRLEGLRGKVDGVVVTGGEPTLQHDLPEFLRALRLLGFQVKLDSNGTNPAVLEQVFAEQLVDYVAMDIKAPLYKYESVVGVPVDTRAIERSVHLIIDSGVQHEFRTTVVDGQLNEMDFEAIAQLVRGAQRYYLQPFVPTKTNDEQFMKRHAPDLTQLGLMRLTLEQSVERCAIRG